MDRRRGLVIAFGVCGNEFFRWVKGVIWLYVILNPKGMACLGKNVRLLRGTWVVYQINCFFPHISRCIWTIDISGCVQPISEKDVAELQLVLPF